MSVFIVHTASALPGPAIPNERIGDFLGELPGETAVREKILQLNGIRTRHYALNEQQEATDTVYQLAARAAKACMAGQQSIPAAPSLVAAGTTYAPLLGPGLGTMIHAELGAQDILCTPIEVSSSSGICSSGAQALVNAVRAVSIGDHRSALAIGVEQPSAILKSSAIRPTDDRHLHPDDIRRSEWFMSVFLRFMLSDGAGAVLLSDQPAANGLSLAVDWTYSRSFAHETPLCMSLESGSLRLRQDVGVLAEHLVRCGSAVFNDALTAHGEELQSYKVILPHISSMYFRRFVSNAIKARAGAAEVPYWTNLATAGNTGAASIYIILDEYLRTQQLSAGERLLLFIPESGQFNFVLISLTAVER